MKIIFLNDAWEDYLYGQATDKSILKKINSLIKEIERLPFEGNGKPEPLKHNLSGWWSRRITLEHSLVYKIEHFSSSIPQNKTPNSYLYPICCHCSHPPKYARLMFIP